MKILFINNIASLQSITADAINENVKGVEANVLSYIEHRYITSGKSVIQVRKNYPKANILYYYENIKSIFLTLYYITKTNLVVYGSDNKLPFSLDLAWAKLLNKKIFVEFMGSDIRNPEYLSTINKYFKDIFHNGYEYAALESSNFKNEVQDRFSKANAKPILAPEMSMYLNKKLFPSYKVMLQRINVKDFSPKFPDIENKKPIILHSPSAPICKGSNIVQQVIAKLSQQYDFDFKYIDNLSREEVLKEMQNCDIFIDQIVCGGYGIASCEAMAFGKPVMCYIMPELFEAGLSSELPIYNCNPDNLSSRLIELLVDPVLRNEIGKRSRAFMEKHHNAEILANQMVEIFKNW